MNVQTERLEDHTARFTVEIEAEQFDKAMKSAARKLSRQVNIPGFRRGKAPYRIVANYVGEAAIIEDAVEDLGGEIYKDALDGAEIDPYGAGSLEDFALEPQPTFTFTVALQPTVNLGDYRAVRLEYEAPVVADKDVDATLESLQEQRALVEESSKPVELSNRVTIDIHSWFLNDDDGDSGDSTEGEAAIDDETAESNEASEEEAHLESEDAEAHGHDVHEHFINQAGMEVNLDEDRELMPGFNEALLGAVVDEERNFDLTYPQDDDDTGDDLAGRTVRFEVTVRKIETRTLPALTDGFAAQVTEDEDEPLTLLQLRMRLRENLETATKERAETEFGWKVLDKIVEGAEIAFPDALMTDQTDHMIEHDMGHYGVGLDDYLRLTQKTHDELRAEYRESSLKTLKRSLALQEIIRVEDLQVAENRVDEEIDEVVTAQFGEQAAMVRDLFAQGQMRDNIRGDMLQREVLKRLAKIARGEALDDDTDSEEQEAVADETAAPQEAAEE